MPGRVGVVVHAARDRRRPSRRVVGWRVASVMGHGLAREGGWMMLPRCRAGKGLSGVGS